MRPPEIVVAAKKPPRAYRVVVLGGSAAYGWNAPDFSIGRILEYMLQESMPERDIEVYNCALVGMCSSVMDEVMRACARFEPDLVVVYMGNNEFGGPFRMTAVEMVASLPSWAARPLIRAGFVIRNSRLAQCLSQAGTRLHAAAGPDGHAPLLYSRPYAQAYGLYRANISSICEISTRAGATVALSTVGYNLRDLPCEEQITSPVSSSEEEALRWQTHYDRGKEFQEHCGYENAINEYDCAIAIFDRHPELLTRAAQCRYALGGYVQARELYDRAVYSADIPRSASVLTNAIVRAVADVFVGRGVLYVDVEGRLSDASPHGISGAEFFMDHCHANFTGQHLIASAIFEAVQASVEAPNSADAARTQPPSEAACRRALALTHAEELNDLRCALAAPFPKSEAKLREQIAALECAVETEAPDADLQALEAALLANPGAPRIAERYVRELVKLGRRQEALECARRLAERYPWVWRFAVPYFEILQQSKEAEHGLEALRALVAVYPEYYVVQSMLAWFGLRAGDLDTAHAAAMAAIALAPSHVDGYQALAEILAQTATPGESQATWRTLAKKHADAAPPYFFLGVSLSEQGEHEAAIEMLGGAVELAVDQQTKAQALEALGRAHAAVGAVHEAARCYREAICTFSYFPEAYAALDLVLRSDPEQNRVAVWTSVADAVAENAPNVGLTWFFLAQARQEANDAEGAAAAYRKAITAETAKVDYHAGLAQLLFEGRAFDEAIPVFRTALQLQPSHQSAREGLIEALWEAGRRDEALAEAAAMIKLYGHVSGDLAVLLGIAK